MSFLLDSNILISFLNGNSKIKDWILTKKRESNLLFISVISKIEVLSLEELTSRQVEEVEGFLDSFLSVPLNEEVVALSSAMRRKNIFTLGDAVILASAIQTRSTLVTNDRVLSKKAAPFIETLSLL